MKHLDSMLHVRGKSIFMDDRILPEGTLHGAVLVSPVSRGRIESLETSRAESIPGVRAVLTCDDIPGENQIGNIIHDEPLFANGEVSFMGEPLALVIAESRAKAREALGSIQLEIEELPGVFDPREAYSNDLLIAPPRTFSLGDTENALKKCHCIVRGRADSGGQEHVYLETQGSIAVPQENGCIRIFAGTQGPTYVQKIAARVLGLPMNRIEVEVNRLGGAFGGKEDQATPWAVMAALGAWKTGKPVKLLLDRQDDMRWTGKRHPYSSDFRLGLSRDGMMLAWEVTYYQNGGAASDLSTAILERTLLHCTNAYYVPNVRATGICCRTNLPPNTAFRGFGAPQAMFVMESAIHRASLEMGIPAGEIQKKNLIRRNDTFPYGMKYQGNEVRRSWQEAEAGLGNEEGNSGSSSPHIRTGRSCMPVCFGISFTNTSLNQASALVHVYVDGSVGVSTGAVEMGQGVNTKIAQTAARTLGIRLDRVKIETTNTSRVANTSPTAASSGADMNGNATRIACEEILHRLIAFAGTALGIPQGKQLRISNGHLFLDCKQLDYGWDRLVEEAYLARVNLSSQAHYATPGIYFDREEEKGSPFAYHVGGTAVTDVTVDCLRGTFNVDRVLIVHDLGNSINPLVDLGQIEGGLLQGIGWMTMEELKYNGEGRLLSDSLATYKIPDIHSAPSIVDVRILECTSENAGIYNSKAVGEPPFMYGIGTYFAVLDAISGQIGRAESLYSSPMSNQRLLELLEGI